MKKFSLSEIEQLLMPTEDGASLISRLAEFMDNHCIDINEFATIVKQDKGILALLRIEGEKNRLLKKTLGDHIDLNELF
jgi:hypothetical protein